MMMVYAGPRGLEGQLALTDVIFLYTKYNVAPEDKKNPDPFPFNSVRFITIFCAMTGWRLNYTAVTSTLLTFKIQRIRDQSQSYSCQILSYTI